MAGCGPHSGCNHVLASRWAYWFGLPVSLPAIVAYLILLGLTWKPGRWVLITALASTVIAAAGWFVALQYFVIGSWCKFCLATHASASAGAALLIWEVPRACRPRSGHVIDRAAAAGVAGVCFLAAGQLAVNKQLIAVTPVPAAAGTNTAPNLVSLYNGAVSLDPNQLPAIGPETATNFFVSLFDYTCVHCRRLHPVLVETLRRFNGRLAIIALPTPLEKDCNPYLPATNPANSNACEYARLGLSVWHARPRAFREFDDWMFATPIIPALDEARAKAESLVGRDALSNELAGMWVATQIKMDVDLYATNYLATHNAQLPQLIFGDAALHGTVTDAGALIDIINQHKLLRVEHP